MDGKGMGYFWRSRQVISDKILRWATEEQWKRAGLLLLGGILGFVLSQSVIFDEYSPFGIAFCVSMGSHMGGLIGTIGAVVGYILRWRGEDHLKYACGAVLAYFALVIFKNSSISKKKYFAPFVGAASTFFVGFVVVAERGFPFTGIVLFLTEVILVFASAYYFRELVGVSVLYGKRPEEVRVIRSVALYVMMAVVLLSLNNVRLIAGISGGRLLGILFVMMSAYRGSLGAGSAAGISIGISFDIAGGRGYYSMAYGFSGLVASIVGKNQRLVTAVTFVLSNAVITLVDAESGIRISALFEAFAASIIFMILPERMMPSLRLFDPSISGRPVYADKVKAFVQARMNAAASAFSALAEMMSGKEPLLQKGEYPDLSRIFDRASGKVCRSCALKGFCWDRDSMNTYNTMNEVSGILREKGTLEAKDFPHHFATRCLKLEKLTGAINSEMKLMLCARRYRSRLHLSRSILTGQYSEVAVILREIAEETANGMEEDIEVARYLERALRAHCEAAAEAAFFVWRDQSGKLQIEISGPNIIGAGREIAEVVASLEKTRGIRLGAPEYSVEEVDRVRISEAEMFSVKIGVAAHKRKGSSVSGDSSTYFKTEDGRLFILLSDGMGSGREAAIESGSVVRLTEKFLKAGIEPVTTLQTVAQALLLRNLEEGGFATIDLMELNLAVGECRFYKQGAAPTFMKNGRKVRSYVGKAFPPGIGPEEYPADLPILQLEGGETLIMLSDGAYGPTGDIWLGEMLDEFPEESPKEIALRVAGEASLRSDGKDDVTVIAMKIQRNK